MKKILSISLLLTSFYPSISQATIIFITPIEVTVVVKTNNGDDNFHFDLSSNSGGVLDSFDIKTENGTGSFTSPEAAVVMYNPGSFTIMESTNPGWSVDSIVCTGDDLVSYSSPLGGPEIVNFTAAPYKVNCTFNNSKHVTGKTPVLIIPGILGTEIKDQNDQILWANPAMVDPLNSDSFMDPMSFGFSLMPVDSGVINTKVIKTLPLYDYSGSLIDEFKSQGYVEDQNLFTFPYDWRYGVSGLDSNGKEINVEALKQKVSEIAKQTGSDKVDVVAHSTGGLLLKKYVLENKDSHHIGKAVFVGVPNLGAPKAAKTLLQGDNFGVLGLNDDEIKKITQNMPISYELLPSKQYLSSIGSFLTITDDGGITMKKNDLDYDKSIQFLKDNDENFNSNALAKAESLHTSDFDNHDLQDDGVDVYKIVGCSAGTLDTIGSLDQYQINIGKLNLFKSISPKFVSGDGTVPYESAESLPGDIDKQYYAIDANHGKMLSQKGIRQQIVNIIAGTSLDVGNKVISRLRLLENISRCQLNGRVIRILSPVDIEVKDSEGNRLGKASDGSLQNDIPGADFEIWGEHKYVYLPKTDSGLFSYEVSLLGTGRGTFTLGVSDIVNNNVSKEDVFSNVPVTPSLKGNVYLQDGVTTKLVVDKNGDGVNILNITPSSVVSGQQTEDLLPPKSTLSISGQVGKNNFYRNDVMVNIKSEDQIVPERPEESSGILSVHYNIDNKGYVETTSTSTSIKVVNEGVHTIKYFATDKAGNNEEEKSIVFTIDKTAPEFLINFSTSAKDLMFKGSDNISSGNFLTILDQDDHVSLQDEAGNKTEIYLKDKNRKRNLHANIKSLTYNGVPADINKNRMGFEWGVDKQGNIKHLEQEIASKKDFNIEAAYENGKTKIVGKDKNGKISKTVNGLVILKITTSRGDLIWSY